jgi:putative ABC transport system ATP-binding protein
MMALLQGTNLRKTYRLGRRNLVHALRGVDVTIEEGEMVAIVGPSGSGKSTLMHILGLLHAPDPGEDGPSELRFDGRDVIRIGDDERTRLRAREMGFVFQDFNLVPTLTALENVSLACEYAGVRGAAARTASLASLDLVGLADRATHRPAELSGGEQQRVALARAFAARPAILLADEPTGNLDGATGRRILEILSELRHREGTTLVLVTHDPAVAALADRQIHLRDGRVEREIPALVLSPAEAPAGAPA